MKIRTGSFIATSFALAFISIIAVSAHAQWKTVSAGNDNMGHLTETPAPPQQDTYGAIAYSPSTRRFGSSWNHRSPEVAERQAMAMCNRSDCRVLMPLASNCGSLAVARNGGYVWSTGGSLYDAKLSTSNRCTQKYGGCKLICSVCSGGNEP